MAPSSSSSNCRFLQPQLPDECWESVFKHLSHHPHDHESLSLVSRHFFSLTNRIRTHLTISDRLLPHLPALLCRFTSLTSISNSRRSTSPVTSTRSSPKSLPSTYPSSIPSTSLTNTPSPQMGCDNSPKNLHVKALASGLKKLRKVDLSGTYMLGDSSIFTLCQNCGSLEVLVVHQTSSLSNVGFANAIRKRPQLRTLGVRIGNVTSELIDALVSLKDLTCLHLSYSRIPDEALCVLAEGGLPLRKLSLPGSKGYGYSGISCLLKKCNNLQYLDLQGTQFLNDECVIELSLLLGNLKVVKLSGNENLTDLSLFTIMLNCPLISEIRMDSTGVGKLKLEEDCLVVNSHLKFLYLAHNKWLDDGSVTMLASVCPNLEMIDLTYCMRVLKGAIDVLQRCCKIQHMDLVHLGCDLPSFRFQFRVNFEVPTLLVLNLSRCRISDEELSYFKELLQQLRMVSLYCCEKVCSDVVAWMIFVRPSLRKIGAPPQFHFADDGQQDLFLRHGCFVAL
ncbi:hypothetical protein PIB30_090372 [Stylosanthes scabra]|uniref:Uncharacterized protein n=1 Tax=Stylosanthes scabra TaxID=79078 RepID=A0ABU6VXF8_9FABA|nr:hypothetical protein [Stylosanthes scabra]